MSTSLLEVDKVTRAYGKLRAVDDLSFAIDRGAIWGFIGPNGAGKTTTMRIVATLDVPDSGDVRVNGTSVLVEPRQVRTQVGFMSDHFQPYPNLDVGEFLDFFARAYGLRGRDRLRTVRSVVAFCRLDTFLDRPATGLSKGMGQRVHLAKTLLHDPQLLILDEPAAGLDPHARIELRELLRELAANGKTVLISSHILSELSEICDGAIVLERGKKVVAGRIGELAQAQTDASGAKLRIRVLGDSAVAERFLVTQPGVAAVRPEADALAVRFTGDDDARATILANLIGAGIRVVEFAGERLDLEDIFMQSTRGKLQ